LTNVIRLAADGAERNSRWGVFMGKGDRRTRRGKLFRKTYGKRRPRKKNKPKKTKS
jgi:30S ribosomal protein S31